MLFSTEQVSKWHPDKFCDQISDAIVTEYLKKDPNAHCGIETMAKGHHVFLAGEVSSTADINRQDIARRVGAKLGYDPIFAKDLVSKQSPEINKAVKSSDKIGAGDQGMMFGYATNETPSMLPYGFHMANEIIRLIEKEVERPGSILKGDAKTQVTVDTSKHGPDSLQTIVVSVCHESGHMIDEVYDTVENALIPLYLGKAKLLVNPAGLWTIGGPVADAGLTGRKIVCDQYGGYCPVGGGAFSGKDPTKVDRSASYMARKIACDLLKKDNELGAVQVQLAYAIGIPEPVSVLVQAKSPLYDDETLEEYVRKTYDLTPRGIIDALDLVHKDYEKIAEGCHYRMEW